MTNYELARDLYYAYFYNTGGVSLVSGAKLPEWDALPQPIKDAWEASARCVFQYVAEGMFDEYRRIAGLQPYGKGWVHRNCGGFVSGQEYEKYGFLWTCDNCPETWNDEGMFDLIRYQDYLKEKNEQEDQSLPT